MPFSGRLMTIMICAAGLGLFGVMARFWSPASALAAALLLAIALRAVVL